MTVIPIGTGIGRNSGATRCQVLNGRGRQIRGQRTRGVTVSANWGQDPLAEKSRTGTEWEINWELWRHNLCLLLDKCRHRGTHNLLRKTPFRGLLKGSRGEANNVVTRIYQCGQ